MSRRRYISTDEEGDKDDDKSEEEEDDDPEDEDAEDDEEVAKGQSHPDAHLSQASHSLRGPFNCVPNHMRTLADPSQ